MFTEEGEPLKTPRRKMAIDESIEDLVRAPLAMEDALIALCDHSNPTLQRRVVNTYIRRVYQRHLCFVDSGTEITNELPPRVDKGNMIHIALIGSNNQMSTLLDRYNMIQFSGFLPFPLDSLREEELQRRQAVMGTGGKVKDLKGISVDLLVQGMMVNARVISVLENGIMLSFLTYFTRCVDMFYLENAFQTRIRKDIYAQNKKASKLCNLLPKAVWNAPALGGSSCIYIHIVYNKIVGCLREEDYISDLLVLMLKQTNGAPLEERLARSYEWSILRFFAGTVLLGLFPARSKEDSSHSFFLSATSRHSAADRTITSSLLPAARFWRASHFDLVPLLASVLLAATVEVTISDLGT
ncbi:hypothetical protein ZIOFF_075269 [Zingiber officinale]|uniref:Acetyl-CoA carboxylase central domain-containing protein n=1 Tax=Zingiber officinale TaxID=94328 RepID=A0A8J5EMX2_ZINOF|nr:hypothetical protein ZIOFF_075269 [Zingiber officinale]